MPNDKNWKLISEEPFYKGPYGRVLIKRVFELPDKTTSDFYIRLQPDVVAVVALTPYNHVILARQFRPGPMQYIYELPAGGVEPHDKNIADAAARELLEETGYAGDLVYAGPCIDDAYATTTRHCFVATNCKKVTNQKLDEHEFIDVEQMDLKSFRKLLRGGLMTDVELGYMGLDCLGLL